MKTRLIPKIFNIIAAIIISIASSTVFATIIGVSWSGNVYNINEATGAGASIGFSGFNGLNGLASNSGGTLYTVSNPSPTWDGPLLTIDPNTGLGSSGATVFTSNGVRALAFSQNHTLYGIVDTGSPGSIGPDALVSIDINTGNLTNLGLTGFSGIQGLAFSAGGTLYGWDFYAGLLTIDLTTGIATDINTSVGNAGFDIQTIDFSPDGTLYGARDSLFSIDITTGAPTFIGNGGYSDIRGIAFISEPNTIALLGIAIIGLISMAARRKWK